MLNKKFKLKITAHCTRKCH